MKTKNIILTILIISIIIIASTLLGLSKPKHVASIIDYDYYIGKDHLWLFCLEEEAGKINLKDFDQTIQTGKVIRVYKKNIKKVEKSILNEIKENKLYRTKQNLFESDFINNNFINKTFICNEPRRNMKFVYENDISITKPWSLSVGKIDKNSDINIFVGAYYKPVYQPLDTRPYFLNYNRTNNIISRVWTGSYLNMNTSFIKARFVKLKNANLDLLLVKEYHRRDKQNPLKYSYYTYSSFAPWLYNRQNEKEIFTKNYR